MARLVFADVDDRELRVGDGDVFAAVYAAGGGKRNMANFVRSRLSAPSYRPGDIYLSLQLTNLPPDATLALFICRLAWTARRPPGALA